MFLNGRRGPISGQPDEIGGRGRESPYFARTRSQSRARFGISRASESGMSPPSGIPNASAPAGYGLPFCKGDVFLTRP
jgi:hypothetical protein